MARNTTIAGVNAGTRARSVRTRRARAARGPPDAQTLGAVRYTGYPGDVMTDARTATTEAKRASGALLVPVAAALIAIAFLFAPLAKLGIWDPYELDAADLARRVAIWAFPHPSSRIAGAGLAPSSADPLWQEGAHNGMPTLSDLRMGELPFTSMALAFRVFGLHEWTGRLPLACWGLAGAMAVYALVARLVDRRAGLYATTALVTMPLYFLHARTMLGDIVTMSALAIALAGLGGVLLDRPAGARVLWGLAGAGGLVAGYLSRGLLVGVAIPALAAGLTALVLEAGARPVRGAKRSLADTVLGGVVLGIGAFSAAYGLWLLRRTAPDTPLLRHLGFEVLSRAPTESTFDLPLRDLGHGLFPWSAFLPFAVGRLFRPPPIEGEDAEAASARERETGLRVLLLVALGVGFAVYATLGPRAGTLPWSGPAVLAAIAAIAIRDFERGAPPSRALALSVPILGYVLFTDMKRMPEKALAAFSVDKPTFPKSFETQSELILAWSFALFAGLVALAWFEAPEPRERRGIVTWASDTVTSYVEGARALAAVWAGNLVFVAVVIEAALVGLGAMVFFGRRFGWGAVERLPKNFADASVNVWWIAPIALAIAPIVYVLVRDAFRTAVTAARVPRALATVFGALLAGGVLSFGYYPALAAQLSPKEAFETLSKLAGPDQPLGLLGVRARAAAYYGTGSVTSFGDPTRAFQWLTEPGASRRWLLFKAEDLPRLNSLYRRHHGRNLPVLDGRSSQILLASNQPGGAPDENPLASILLDEPPKPSHPVDASFRGELTALGWDVTDARGQVVDSVVPQTPYHLRFYYRVEEPVSGTWKAFVHIDGFGRRYNGDHAVLDGRYPMSLWNPGDIVVDDLVFQLEPNFLPGDYNVFFGFFSGETRYTVTRGAAQENRVVGGPLRVR